VQRLALFDLDSTLVDRQAAFLEAVAGLCTAYEFGPEIQTWMLTHLADPEDFVRMRETFALAEPATSLWQLYVDKMAAAIVCRPVVLEGLAQLRREGWKIGVVTNGAADIQRAKLTATRLTDTVDGIAISGDAGFRKPDPRLFALAAARCGCVLNSQTWMTGNNPAADIGGGRRAGLRTIWVRGRPWPDEFPPADHDVDDVTDAIAFLLADSPE
jgi:putative hydrolase of the HAD superfamily